MSRLASGLGVVRPPVAEIAGDPGRARLKPDFMPWREVYENPKAMFLTMSGVFGQYLRLLVFPLRLQGDYSPPVLKSWIDARALASWAGWLLLAAAAWALRRSVPAASFGLAWTGATLLPVCGLVSLLNLQAERYLYVPSAGACIAAGALLEEFRRRAKTRGARVWVVGSAAALVAAGAARTVARNRDFASEELFLRATDAIDPSIPRVHFNLARLRAFAGDSVGAEAELRKALSIWPQFSAARLILARQLMGEARWEGAIEVLEATPEGEAIEETRYLLEFSRWRRTHRDAPESEFARVWAEKARKG
ncbi:MAG: hypothetical protein HY078_00095 [Elusimicrobia bacterium]|nr:hypothetical protein [Elusimicrobiota bacterium]